MNVRIQISDGLRKELSKRKVSREDTFEDVIWDLIESGERLSEKSRKNIRKARNQIKKGSFFTHEQVKERLGL
jgi:hypothetical protein